MQKKSNGRKAKAAIRQGAAVQMRIAGHTLQQIADALGYRSVEGARKAVLAAMAAAARPEEASALRALELQRLDKLFAKSWQAAMEGDGEQCDRCLKIMARRAKLCGLDQPPVQRYEDVGPSDGEIGVVFCDFYQSAARMRQVGEPPQPSGGVPDDSWYDAEAAAAGTGNGNGDSQ